MEAALDLYRIALANAPRPVPADLLMQMSGDLGKAGQLAHSLLLTEPHFDPAEHGLIVGNNLIKSHLELGHVDAAEHIKEQLFALNRPDWKQTLNFWDTEIAKARLVQRPANSETGVQTVPQVTLHTILGPVWLPSPSPAEELFPRTQTSLHVSFLGASASMPSDARVQLQLADTPGRLSRALPLFLAEQAFFRLPATVETLVPWAQLQPGSFIFSGQSWQDAEAARFAAMSQPASDYVVTTHLFPSAAAANPWRAELRLVRVADSACAGTTEISFPIAASEPSLLTLADQLIALLVQNARLTASPSPAMHYVLPPGRLSDYMLRLEQLLATRCAAMPDPHRGTLNGERNILDGNLDLCLAFPANVPARLILAQTVVSMNKIRPDVNAEFLPRLERLQQVLPLAEPAGSAVASILKDLGRT